MCICGFRQFQQRPDPPPLPRQHLPVPKNTADRNLLWLCKLCMVYINSPFGRVYRKLPPPRFDATLLGNLEMKRTGAHFLRRRIRPPSIIHGADGENRGGMEDSHTPFPQWSHNFLFRTIVLFIFVYRTPTLTQKYYTKQTKECDV